MWARAQTLCIWNTKRFRTQLRRGVDETACEVTRDRAWATSNPQQATDGSESVLLSTELQASMCLNRECQA